MNKQVATAPTNLINLQPHKENTTITKTTTTTTTTSRE